MSPVARAWRGRGCTRHWKAAAVGAPRTAQRLGSRTRRLLEASTHPRVLHRRPWSSPPPIPQGDAHHAALTVRETLNFAETCLGRSNGARVMLQEWSKWEAEHGVERTEEDEKVRGCPAPTRGCGGRGGRMLPARPPALPVCGLSCICRAANPSTCTLGHLSTLAHRPYPPRPAADMPPPSPTLSTPPRSHTKGGQADSAPRGKPPAADE